MSTNARPITQHVYTTPGGAVEPIPERMPRFKGYLADSHDDKDDGELEAPTDEHPANLMSSKLHGFLDDGWHAPALDIDVPLEVIPSSTPGHCHLLFPTVRCTWEQYVALLEAMGEAGILGPGFVAHSINRGQSLLRLPGVKKEPK